MRIILISGKGNIVGMPVGIQYKDQIIEYIERGERLEDAIKGLGLGVTRQALSRVLKDDPDYNDAFVGYHAARLDKAEKMIEDAADQIDVARARAFHEAVRWRASKEARSQWGDTPVQQGGDVQVTINISGVHEGITIDHES